MEAKVRARGYGNYYKGYIRAMVEDYCRKQGINQERFKFVSLYQWEDIYNKILSNFADWQWARYNGLHWLNTNGTYAKDVAVCYAFDSRGQEDWILNLPSIVDDNKMYLAIEEPGKFWIAEGDARAVAEVIYEELWDDYYIVSCKYQWMITCNHHEVISFIEKNNTQTEHFRLDMVIKPE